MTHGPLIGRPLAGACASAGDGTPCAALPPSAASGALAFARERAPASCSVPSRQYLGPARARFGATGSVWRATFTSVASTGKRVDPSPNTGGFVHLHAAPGSPRHAVMQRPA